MEEMLRHKYESVTADAGYENEENYLWLEKEGKTGVRNHLVNNLVEGCFRNPFRNQLDDCL